MGRKADPRGKDRPRTIVLAGDVAEIAQKLADKGELSSTLSELLRHNYGFGDHHEEKKRALTLLLDEKQRLTDLTQVMADEIDALEVKVLEQNATIRPAIEKRIKIYEERILKARQALQAPWITPHERQQKENVMHNNYQMLEEARKELEELL